MINALIMNTVGPFIIWKQQKIATVVSFNGIDKDKFMENVSDEYRDLVISVEALGFQCLGSSALAGAEFDTFFRLYWHADLKVAATCVYAPSVLGEVMYLEFSQKYVDGSMLDVSNSPIVDAYPKLKIKTAYRYPLVTDSAALLDIFTTLKKSHKSSLSAVDFDQDAGFKEVEAYMRTESDELLRKGIVKPKIDSDGMRSLTFYGALCLTYRSTAPWANIIGYFSEKKAMNALKTL